MVDDGKHCTWEEKSFNLCDCLADNVVVHSLEAAVRLHRPDQMIILPSDLGHDSMNALVPSVRFYKIFVKKNSLHLWPVQMTLSTLPTSDKTP